MTEIVPYSSLQEVFDKSYIGLAKQGFLRSEGRSSHGNSSCMYRDKFGHKCAIGHLVPDELVDSTNNTKGLIWIFNDSFGGQGDARWKKLFEGFQLGVLINLQQTHDNSFEVGWPSPKKMRSNLEAFAEKYGLTVPKVEFGETA